MTSIRPGLNGHQGGPPPQPYSAIPPGRSNGYPPPGPPNAGHPPPNVASPNYPSASAMGKQLSDANEDVWMNIGRLQETMEDVERARAAYESAIKNNPDSIRAKKALALLYKDKLKEYGKAIDLFQQCVHDEQDAGYIWAMMGHCYLMNNELPRAYHAYQSGLASARNANDPDVWYGIGLLYDRYASFEHAEEAFSNVLYINPGHRKRNEIYFRLGIIYKQQKKYPNSIACFEYILESPPEPLTTSNIWTQIGYVHQVAGDYLKAREAFESVLHEEPESAKVLLQLGYIHSIPDSRIRDLERALWYIERALAIDPKDPQAWYYLGRFYMQRANYSKAYEAYQQAVYRDSRNSNFWCSIGVLYWEINQYRDALDAYTRAIRLNPYIPEIWFNLGTLYEACNNQVQDAIDAYNRAYELDSTYYIVEQRLNILKRNMETGRTEGPTPPRPSDIDPQRYEDFLQNQQNQQNAAQLQGIHSSQWGPPASGAPPPGAQHRPPYQPPPPQHLQHPARRSPDLPKGAPYGQPPPAGYSNGSSGYRPPPPPGPVNIKRGNSPPPPHPYGYDARPPMDGLPHQGYRGHDEMSHRPPIPPPSQAFHSPRQHERDLHGPPVSGGGSYPPSASRSPVSTYPRGRSPPISQHGPPPDVKPLLDQGPPISPSTSSHNVQLAPLQSVRSPQTNIPPPPLPRNDAPAYPPPSHMEPKRPREWEERDYNRAESRSSSHSRVEPPVHHEERRASNEDRPRSHDPTPPRPRSPLVSPRSTEPSYAPPHPPPEHKSPPTRMELDSPRAVEKRSDPLPVPRVEESEKMQVDEDKRPEAEAPARAMEVDEDYDKEDDKPEEK